MAAPSLCLIAPGHIASTPRLVKNADALAAAGYQVHVLFGRNYPPVDPLDVSLLRDAAWSHTRVDLLGGAGAQRARLVRAAARWLARRTPVSTALAARALHPAVGPLVAAARRIPAQLYYGHCLAGLPIAAAAARHRGAAYGFDAEDYHDAETAEALADRAEVAIRRKVQSALLPGCRIFTAGSPLIAQEYGRQYGREGRPILNVFPRSHAPAAPVDPGPIGPNRPARCYWFSQTIGPGRGLEATIAALARMNTPVELHLRGFVGAEYAAHLRAHAGREGLARPIQFLESGSPAEMVRLSAPYDLGLCVEEWTPLNHRLCLANKVFVYLLAGIPQLMSDTPAMSGLARELEGAALCCAMADPAAVARELDGLLGDPARTARARRTAWDLARRRYCWEIEQEVLLGAVRAALPL
ncbi:MAG TPA: hypothetical protein VHV47_03450 [Opitutaceae bacterium]|jgi:hypothetical protein|nr:hypothetical protein [Opitutaceae bacterium]